MLQPSPYEDLYDALLKDGKQVDVIAGLNPEDYARSRFTCTQGEADVYFHFLALGLGRLWMNAGYKPDAEDDNKIYLWVIKEYDPHNLFVKTTEHFVHIVIPDGMIEQIIDFSFRAVSNQKFLPIIDTDGLIVDMNDFSRIPWERGLAFSFLTEPTRYRFASIERQALVNLLMDLMFIFCIDHEFCHFEYHHTAPASFDFTNMKSRQAREIDADCYAANNILNLVDGKCSYKLFNDPHDKILEILRCGSRDGSDEIFHILLFAVYSVFQIFDKTNWSITTDFNHPHPSLPCRFRAIIACYDDLARHSSMLRLADIHAAIRIADEQFPSLYTIHRDEAPKENLHIEKTSFSSISTQSSVIQVTQTEEANQWYNELYAEWCRLANQGIVGSWLPPDHHTRQ